MIGRKTERNSHLGSICLTVILFILSNDAFGSAKSVSYSSPQTLSESPSSSSSYSSPSLSSLLSSSVSSLSVSSNTPAAISSPDAMEDEADKPTTVNIQKRIVTINNQNIDSFTNINNDSNPLNVAVLTTVSGSDSPVIVPSLESTSVVTTSATVPSALSITTRSIPEIEVPAGEIGESSGSEGETFDVQPILQQDSETATYNTSEVMQNMTSPPDVSSIPSTTTTLSSSRTSITTTTMSSSAIPSVTTTKPALLSSTSETMTNPHTTNIPTTETPTTELPSTVSFSTIPTTVTFSTMTEAVALLGDSCSTLEDCSHVDHSDCVGPALSSVCKCTSGYFQYNISQCLSNPVSPVLIRPYQANQTSVTVRFQRQSEIHLDERYTMSVKLGDDVYTSTELTDIFTLNNLSPGTGYVLDVTATVQTSNGSDVDAESNNYTIHTKPVPPIITGIEANLSDDMSNGQSVNVCWSLDTGSADNFSISVGQVSESGIENRIITGVTSYSCPVTALLAGWVYRFIVTAELGPWSVPSQPSKYLTSPPAPIIRSIQVVASSVRVLLQPPNEAICPGTTMMHVLQRFTANATHDTASSNTTMIQLSSLRPAHLYNISVHSVVSAGDMWTESTKVIRTTYTVPLAPVVISHVSTASNVTVHVNTSGLSSVVRYSVMYCSSQSHLQTRSLNNGCSSTTHSPSDQDTLLITGLRSATEYRLYIAAMINGQDNNGQELRSPTTNLTLYTAPVIPVLQNVTHGIDRLTTANLIWRRSIEAAVQYVIQYSFSGQNISKEVDLTKDCKSDQSCELTVTELSPGTLFTFHVQSAYHNLISQSQPMYLITAPTAPESVHVTAVTETSMSLEWTHSGRSDRFIMTLLSQPGADIVTPTVVDSDDRRTSYDAIQDELQPGQYYKVTIDAVVGGMPGMLGNQLVKSGSTIYNYTRPSPPASLAMVNKTADTIWLRWSSPAQRFSVIMSPENGTLSDPIIDQPMGNVFMHVTNLHPARQYNFTVFAITDVWESLSATIHVLTNEIAPGEPQNLQVHLESRSANISWQPPVVSNGEILYYQITYWKQTLGPELHLPIVNHTSPVLWYRDATLDGGYCYVFRVQAANSAGVGSAIELSVTIPDAPSMPRNVQFNAVLSSSITITWDLPLYPGGIIIRQDLHVRKDNGDCIKKVEFHCTDCPASLCPESAATDNPQNSDDAGSDTAIASHTRARRSDDKGSEWSWRTDAELCPEAIELPFSHASDSVSYTVDSLLPYTNYHFLITSFNSFEHSPTQNQQNMTLQAAPSKPLNLTAEHSSTAPTTLVISWLIPENKNGIINFYVVSHNTSAGQWVNKNTSTAVTTLEIDDLQPWTVYGIKVMACTIQCGQASSTVYHQTPPGRPGTAPMSFKHDIRNSTAILLSWQPPSVPNGLIVGYHLTYQELDQSEEIQLAGDVHRHWVETLRPAHEYTFSLVALTSAGAGPAATVTVRTEQGIPGVPASFTAESINATSVRLTWRAPDHPNGAIMEYVIKYGIRGGAINGNITVGSTTRRQPVHGLRYWTHYDFTINAVTSKGSGVKAETTTRTNEYVPTSPPATFQVSVLNATALALSWQPPHHPNGVITSYDITYRDTSPGSEETTNHVSGDTTSTLLSDLHYWTPYTVRIHASTAIGPGPSDTAEQRTDESAPTSTVQNVAVTVVNATTLRLSWQAPAQPNGRIIAYSVAYNRTENEHQNIRGITARSVTVTGLHYWTVYQFAILASTSQGLGPAAFVTGRTDEYVPTSPVTGIHLTKKTANSIQIHWSAPEQANGVIVQYSIHYEYRAHVPGSDRMKRAVAYTVHAQTSFTLTDLYPYWDYILLVKAHTQYGVGTADSERFTAKTTESVPEKVRELKAEPINSTVIRLSWQQPQFMNGIFNGYTIKYTSVNSNNKPVSVSTSNTTDHILAGLEVWTMYHFTVQGKTTLGAGVAANTTARTKEARPDAPVDTSTDPLIQFGSENQLTDSAQQIEVVLRLDFFFDSLRGQPTHWGIIVAQDDFLTVSARKLQYIADFESIKKEYVTWREYNDGNAYKAYRATPDNWNPKHGLYNRTKRDLPSTMKYVIGKGGNCDGFCNGPLKPDTQYRVRVFVCTGGGCTESKYSQSYSTAGVPENLVPVVAAVCGSLVAVAVIVGVILLMKRKNIGPWQKQKTEELEMDRLSKRNSIRSTIDAEAAVRTTPVLLTDFENHVKRMRKDSNLGFEEEYRRLKSISAKHPSTHSTLEVNRPKNRYTNILTYDHSRVKLLPMDDDEGSDYINASYMPGESSRREYIAAQGPMPSTIDDFWRMIWEQNISIVVMLTQLVERGKEKCSQYWPIDDEPVYYGDLIVHKRSESVLSDYDIRIFDVNLREKTRTVRHYNLTKWADFDCPQTTQCLLAFIKAVRHDIKPDMKGPQLIHCSAGVGRTGTFIAVDRILEQITKHENVDIFSLVLEMRDSRNHMVQTEDQYVYIHECVRDSFNNLYGAEMDADNPAYEDDESPYENEENDLTENTAVADDDV